MNNDKKTSLEKTDDLNRSLTKRENNLLEKFTTPEFHKVITRAGNEDFSLVSIDDEKMQEIAKRMDEVNRGLNAFAKTNTQLVSLGLTLSEATPSRNIRQIHAQIESKRAALSESQFRLLKQQNDLKRKLLRRREIENAEVGEGKKYPTEEYKQLDLERIDIDISEIKARMVDGRVHIEQAIKEIGMYQDALDDIVNAFNLQNWDEIDMEKADLEYNLKRCFYQSLRSCRQMGYINEPNQEWLEQMGINPSFVQREMLMFLEEERKVMDEIIKKEEGFADNLDVVDNFIDHLVQKYYEFPINRIKKRGMKTHLYDKWTYKNPKREEIRKNMGENELAYKGHKNESKEE
jgi:hypothetical protein